MKRFLFAAILTGLCASGIPAAAQAQDPRTTVNSERPIPDRLELHRLIWSTMAAIHHANKSGNYSVLRDLGAAGFQVQNSAAQLATIFQNIRERRIDLSNTLLLAPEFLQPPTMVAEDVMRLQGRFGLRPLAIDFDLYYQYSGGEWRLFGVGIQPVELATVQPDGVN